MVARRVAGGTDIADYLALAHTLSCGHGHGGHMCIEGIVTVVVIEHNLEVVKTADYIIDIGPEGGDGGGTIVVAGTPEEVVQCEKSYTGQYLKKLLER